MDSIYDILYNPINAFVVFSVFLVGYIIFLNEEDAFSKKFLNFGPSEDTYFLNMKLNTWTKVITVYLVSFFTSIILAYYTNVSSQFIGQYLYNPAITHIKGSKTVTLFIVTFEQVLFAVLSLINFFTKTVMELQFLIPQLLGLIVVNLPFNIYQAQGKIFSSP